MKIALDSTYSTGRDLSGVGVYSRELTAALAAAHPGARFLCCYRPHRFLRSFLEPLPSNARRALLWEASAPRADLFHALNQRLPRRPPRTAVVTFHDLFVLTGEYSTPEFRDRFAAQARHAADHAALIITVSEFTAGQVHELLGVEHARIRVVHHGVRPRHAPPPVSRENIILHVGAIQKRKNVERLVEAFERLDRGWRLVLAGASGYGAAEIMTRIARSPARERIVVTGYVTRQTLDDWYARAAVFAFPSLDEGFGMPVLEAMAAGVPVVTSNRSALPEVAGGAALLVDPASVDDISGALDTLIRNRARRAELAVRGRRRAADFTWERTAALTWAAYAGLLAGQAPAG